MKVQWLLFAQMLGVALPSHADAQMNANAPGAVNARHATRSTTRAKASGSAPAIPRTLAGDALRAWINAFNSADSVRLVAYARQFERDVIIGDELGFREQTGGFDLVSIEWSERRHIEFIVRERKSSTTAYGAIDVSAEAPAKVTARRFQPLGPNVVASTIRLDAAVRARTVSAAATLLDTFYVAADVARRAGDGGVHRIVSVRPSHTPQRPLDAPHGHDRGVLDA